MKIYWNGIELIALCVMVLTGIIMLIYIALYKCCDKHPRNRFSKWFMAHFK